MRRRRRRGALRFLFFFIFAGPSFIVVSRQTQRAGAEEIRRNRDGDEARPASLLSFFGCWTSKGELDGREIKKRRRRHSSPNLFISQSQRAVPETGE